MLGVISLIVALAGVTVGAFSFISMNNYINDRNSYVLPMARTYYDGSLYTIVSGSLEIFNYNQKSYDTHGAFNLTSDTYTIPEPGFYQVIAQYSIDARDGDIFMIQLFSNTNIVGSTQCSSSVNTNTFGVALTGIFNFTTGDSLIIKLYQYNSGEVSRDIYNGEAYNFFAIAKIA